MGELTDGSRIVVEPLFAFFRICEGGYGSQDGIPSIPGMTPTVYGRWKPCCYATGCSLSGSITTTSGTGCMPSNF